MKTKLPSWLPWLLAAAGLAVAIWAATKRLRIGTDAGQKHIQPPTKAEPVQGEA